MYRYTTPILPITLSGIDFSEVSVFRVKMKQGSVMELLKEISVGDPHIDSENHKIYVPLTQEETASFVKGTVDLQIRMKLSNGDVCATNEVVLPVKNVLDEVII